MRLVAASEGPVVERRYLSVLTESPVRFRQGSGRRELADAIVGPAAPLVSGGESYPAIPMENTEAAIATADTRNAS